MVFLQLGPNQPGLSIFPGNILFPFLAIFIMPPRFPAASNSTTTGALIGDKQYGNIQAFRCFLTSIETNVGFGSTKSPVQLYFISKYNVLDFISPSNAPASIKNLPPRWAVCVSTKILSSYRKAYNDVYIYIMKIMLQLYFVLISFYHYHSFSSLSSVHKLSQLQELLHVFLDVSMVFSHQMALIFSNAA